MEKFYTVKEVAENLHTSPETVKTWIKKGWLKPTKAGTRRNLLTDASVEAFFADSAERAKKKKGAKQDNPEILNIDKSKD